MTAQQSTEAETLEQALDGALQNGSPSVSARSEAAAAVTLLQSDELHGVTDGSIDDDKLAALTAVHRRLRHALDERVNAVDQIAAQWWARASLEKAVRQGAEAEAFLAASLADIEREGHVAAGVLAARTADREIATEGIRALASAKDRLTKLSAELLAILHDADLLGPASQTWGSIQESIVESGWTAAARDQRRRDLEALSADLHQATGEEQRLRLLDADIDRIGGSVVSEEAMAVLRRDAESAEARSRAARLALEATAEPVARLQSAARDLIAHDHGAGASECPACAYDWGSAEKLRAAIAAALEAGPQIAHVVGAGAALAAEAANAARARLDSAVAARDQMGALVRERASLAAAAARRQRMIEQLGIASDQPAASIAQARLRLQVADALAAVISAHDEVSPALPGGPAPLLPSETPLSNTLDQLDANFAAREQIVQLQLSELVKAIENATALRDQLRGSHADRQQQLSACRSALQAKAAEVASLRKLWDAVAPDIPWSDDALGAVKSDVGRTLDRLAKAEAHIQAARAAWESEARRARLDSLLSAIQPSLDRQKHMTARIAAANRARAVFHDAYTTISRKQVLGLSRVVNPLFARMHANRVFDRINLGEDADFLHWLADAGGEQLDPGKDFSQGQRQDLALALFLARARSLGGTFFLDEPVIHLDDLNRVGLLDILRAIVLEGSRSLNLVITTSSRALARHLIEKFAGIATVETPNGPVHPLRVLELDGNGRSGVAVRKVYPLQ
jgi:DNA repair exonuclease SbcCD ATPase subunit